MFIVLPFCQAGAVKKLQDGLGIFSRKPHDIPQFRDGYRLLLIDMIGDNFLYFRQCFAVVDHILGESNKFSLIEQAAEDILEIRWRKRKLGTDILFDGSFEPAVFIPLLSLLPGLLLLPSSGPYVQEVQFFLPFPEWSFLRSSFSIPI
jgi:hypothetical protein